jgi:hypothetical protein
VIVVPVTMSVAFAVLFVSPSMLVLLMTVFVILLGFAILVVGHRGGGRPRKQASNGHRDCNSPHRSAPE